MLSSLRTPLCHYGGISHESRRRRLKEPKGASLNPDAAFTQQFAARRAEHATLSLQRQGRRRSVRATFEVFILHPKLSYTLFECCHCKMTQASTFDEISV